MPAGAVGVTDSYTLLGSFKDGIGEVSRRDVTWRDDFYRGSLADAALLTLHESLHQFRGFTDQVLANAARAAAREAQETYGDNAAEKLRASGDINDIIKARCRPRR